MRPVWTVSVFVLVIGYFLGISLAQTPAEGQSEEALRLAEMCKYALASDQEMDSALKGGANIQAFGVFPAGVMGGKLEGAFSRQIIQENIAIRNQAGNL